MDKPKSEKILDIATKRGFVYPSAEIYGSKAGFWTYGSLGTKIKHKWENIWRKSFLSLNTNFYEIDDCNIMPKKVFESSGHLKHFNDTMTECEKCHSRFRADQIVEDTLKIDVGSLKEKELTILIRENKIKCLNCKGNLSEARFFNIMFGPFKVGVTGEDEVYLRPESAQSPYLAFKREFEATRRRLPLGLAVVGNAFSKEMNEKLKFPKFYVYHMVKVQEFYLNIMQIREKLFRFRELDSNERAFYNKIHFDVELNLESLGGWKEVSGVHYRGDYDLGGHQLGSGEKLEVTIDEAGKVKRFIPHVLELSFGVDRNIWALLDIFYKEEKERTLFSFPSNLT